MRPGPIALTTALAMAASGCAPTPPPGMAGQADDRPPIARCEGVRNINWRRFDPWADRFRPGETADSAERAEATGQRQAAMDTIRNQAAAAPHRPSAEAVIVIRAFVGPRHHHTPTEYLGMTWREPDGQWWVWSRWLEWGEPLRPPPPPPLPGEPPAPPQVEEVRFPPLSGRLAAEAAARMEAAWADPCRAWEPDSAPWAIPLTRPDAGSRARERVCPGSAPVIAEITEAGRPPRLISYPCNMAFSTDRLVTMTAFARPEIAEPGG
ncbi:MAG: hypothetical protein U1E18_21645 [Brevundimonas sp.]|uniref:hypothetical protein n=1 Tax=Brevundimonas sp. TaxID=1871086 RepID=UPI00271FCE04|nr:hypothetical protein [Brevundimonas sp.]MDO9586907.1 hypothetical protein [Brevundimonas sp.]MDP3368313.1 hypothetical protein [Brevundimonas sp.]MDZ4112179.1 hypothetical protein [Brevundimonas sp.]